MIKRQPPLLDSSSGKNLPSPLFAGRPGWGGQLKSWLSENAYVVTFRLVLTVALALVVVSIVRNRPTQVAIDPTPSPTATVEAHSITALPGEGVSHLAARALDEHLERHPEHRPFSAARHFYAVDQLWRKFTDRILKPGDTLEFPHELLEAAISAAQAHRK